MNDNWPIAKIGDCASLVRHTLGPDACNGEKYIGLEHIGEGSLTITSTGDGTLVQSAKSKFQAGDALFGKLRPYFRKVAIAPFDGVCSTDIWVIRAKTGTDQRFLFYRLASQEFIDAATRGSEGTKMPRAKWEFVSRFAFPLPPLPIQKRIAHILGTLDDKIELNRRMNETLEAMARAIFKSWFIDFDPVKRNMERNQPAPALRPPSPTGRGAGGEGADALFPSEFQNSDLGLIPKGWGVGMLGDVADVNSHSIRGDYPHEEIEYVDIASVTAGRLGQTTRYPLRDAPSRAQRLVSHGDTIWSCVRPNRRSFLYIQSPPKNLVASTGFAVITPRTVTPSYLHAWTTTDAFVDYLTASADGSAYPAVRPDCFARAKTLIPPQTVLAAHEKLTGQPNSRIAYNAREAARLAATRDTLLPQLLDGKIAFL